MFVSIILSLLFSYYDQIVALEKKPHAVSLKIPFKWKDAFDKGGFLGKAKTLSIPMLEYEKLCILFNIGAFKGK